MKCEICFGQRVVDGQPCGVCFGTGEAPCCTGDVPDQPSATSERYIGWARAGRAPWRRIVEAETESAAWDLLPKMAPQAPNRDLCVLPASGGKP